VLLWPERGLVLNRSAGEILERCRGGETLSTIVKALVSRYPETRPEMIEEDVHRLIADLSRRGLLTLD
jgi:coenzyme PQQ biosynthesis protein PqqD